MENSKIEEKKANNRLRKFCDGLSPERRNIIVLCSLVVFAALAIYMMFDAFNFEYRHRKMPDIDHIRQLDLPTSKTDSINPLKINDYDDR